MTARAIMIQGTASNAGKSVITAGLCRLARRRGLRVAPFKSQNMSLNAAATPDGLEIGRAQALQAKAAGLRPSVDMNPILLKPEGESRSQVVLRGLPRARVDFKSYGDYRAECISAIEESLARLREANDIVIIEGAGSPAEINLMERDLANMFVARLADAEVILVGDIDRGGVFASFVGTLELLPPADRRRISGFIINRFRGDVSLLEPGLDMLQERTGLPTFGVVPYVHPLGLPEEDGQSLVIDNRPRLGAADKIHVAVIRTPRISNHDDFLPLQLADRLDTRFVDDPRALEGVDVIILGGSKATRADLEWLRASGFEAPIRSHVERGGRLLGICGGYQMLGMAISDPHGIEGEPGDSSGLGYLPVTTELGRAKTVREVRVAPAAERSWLTAIASDGFAIAGYEIHCGTVSVAADANADGGGALWSLEPAGGSSASPASPEGCFAGQVVGTLVHGLFDSPGVLAGLTCQGATPRDSDAVDRALDRFADHLERSLDPSALDRWFR